MGTHPIFESDFDCLTDFLRKMRFSRALKGGSNWANLPPEKFPSPQFWNKCIPGTPFARVQAELHSKNLHDPWLRGNYWRYDNVMRKPYPLLLASPRVLRASFIIAFSVLFVEEVLGIHLFGENAWTTDGHEVNPGHMNAADNNMILPGAEGGVLLSFSNSIYNSKTNLTQ